MNFNPEERHKLHDFVIQQTGHFHEPELKIDFPDRDGKRSLSMAEIMQIQRRRKFKRMKYRVAKEPPLSHTEEVRGLIDMQMEAYVEFLGGSKSEEPKSNSEDYSTMQRHREKHKKRSRSRERHSSSRKRQRSRSRNHRTRK